MMCKVINNVSHDDNSLQPLQSLIKQLRKTNPLSAKRLQKKLKKKKNKLNHKIKLLSKENKEIQIKKEAKEEQNVKKEEKDEDEETVKKESEKDEEILENVEIEYILPPLEKLAEENKVVEEFLDVFEKFRFDKVEEEEEKKTNFKDEKIKEKEKLDSDEEDENDEKPKISKKKLKQMSRYTLAHLKQLSSRPDVIEVYDCTASDALFLIYLKAYRNSVCVPPHWSSKRKYMQGKRGIEKPPFKLPSYIEATKISEIRRAIQEKDAQKTVRQKQREKVRPKMHRMDIDYQVLHDAFFKYATKPKLTKFGDVYYEGKENEMKMRKFKPGVLSDNLRAALGMGLNAPPPWLINMQRYGPPPSYINLKIPGLNAPIPAGAEYGFHAGGWGKPPVDEFGNPLYGDYSLHSREEVNHQDEKLWGEISENEDEDEDEDQNTESAEGEGMKTPASIMGMDTPSALGISTETSGLHSVGSRISGGETPESVDIRKRGINTVTPKPYTILQQQKAPAQPGALFTSNITYKIPNKNMQMHGHVTPIGGLTTPGGTVTPGVGGVITPYGGGGVPYDGGATPYGGGVTPYGGGVTPYLGGVVTPYGGVTTLYGEGIAASFSGGAIPTGGMVTPSLVGEGGGMANAVGGLQTPVTRNAVGGVTVSLNPSEIEQEGVFAADVIRQQLKQHEEASVRVKRAAGQIDLHESRKRKGESTGESFSKKEKKEKFKF